MQSNTLPTPNLCPRRQRRREVQALAAELGCDYISRPTHESAKAGNLNYALEHTRSELVAVLDADTSHSQIFSTIQLASLMTHRLQ